MTQSGEGNRPNILFVFCDQLRQAAVGCYGQDPVQTPNLDRFAGESVVLTHCVSNQPVCSPHRAMLFSGQYPFRNGVYANCNTARDCELSDATRCLSDVLADEGYSAGYIGKLHLHKPRPPFDHTEGHRPDGIVWDAFTPPGPGRHGFDFWYSYGCCDQHATPHYWTGDGGVETRVDVDEWSVKHETDVAIDFLRNPGGRHRDPDKPFLLMISHNPPHPPFDQVPDEYAELFRGRSPDELFTRPNVSFGDAPDAAEKAARQAALYFGAVAGIDDNFGRLLAALDDLGLADNTIVVFTADHGEMLRSHGLMNKNTWYDESLLVPFLLRWPGRVPPRRDDLLLSVPDIYPTLLGLAGLTDRVPTEVEGKDLSSVVLGRDGERPTSAFYLWPNWRHYGTKPYSSCRGVRTHRHMFVVARTAEGGAEQLILHDSEADPHQVRNVAGEQPGVVAELRAELDRWLRHTNDPWLADGTIEPFC